MTLKPLAAWTIERLRKGGEFELEGIALRALTDTAPKTCAALCGVSLLEGRAAVAGTAAVIVLTVYVVRRHLIARREAVAFNPWDESI